MLGFYLWTALLPLSVLGQTYYINFVFNNNRYNGDKDLVQASKEAQRVESEGEKHSGMAFRESESKESISKEHFHSRSSEKEKKKSTTKRTKLTTSKQSVECEDFPSNTNEQDLCEEFEDVSEGPSVPNTKPSEIPKFPTGRSTIAMEITTKAATTAAAPVAIGTAMDTNSLSKDEIEQTTLKWLSPTAHPRTFFDYPQAQCHEDLLLQEIFGLNLSKDRGLPSKVLCEFSNSWGGPWLLMTRIELPTRIHMRHWFFGYITEDYKDLNINFLALAHIINNMRLAMLIIGQDNNNQLVYNLYDDFVISGFNDLFMLRKAHLIETNTTDLLFLSVGEVLISDAGRNRSCPFRVMGAWWGSKWGDLKQGYCVFPVDRDIHRPGYIAFFIKPSPFVVNNTAFYSTALTTRRPWITTANPDLMAKAKNDEQEYKRLKEKEFHRTKKRVKSELNRREAKLKSIEKNREEEEKLQLDVKILTTIDTSMAKT